MRVELAHQPETWGGGCWIVDICSDDPERGSLHATSFGDRAHAGAFRKGAEAYLRGENKNPYRWDRGIGLAQVGLRGFRNAWQEGWTTAQTLDYAERKRQ